MRQQYETQQDRENEEDVIKSFCLAFNNRNYDLNYFKLPKSYILDYALVNSNNNIQALAEVKCRDVNKDQYDTLILSQKKMMAGIQYYDYFRFTGGHAEFLIIARWNDATGYYKYDSSHRFNHRVGGRTKKTRDNADIEIVIEIPIRYFRILQ